MSPIVRSVPLTLLLACLSGCVHMLLPLTSTPKRSTPFNAARVPAGAGWHCYEKSVGKENSTPCYRTAEECSSARSGDVGRSDVWSVGHCEPQDQAACFVMHREKAGMLFDSKVVDDPTCFARMAECSTLRASWMTVQTMNIDEITECGEVGPTPVASTTLSPAAAPAPIAPAPAPANAPSGVIKGTRVAFLRTSAYWTPESTSFSLFDSANPADFKGQFNLDVDGALVVGKEVPVQLSFLQLPDAGSPDGVRNMTSSGCSGKGTLRLSKLPKLNKKAANGDILGPAEGELKLDVSCAWVNKDYGTFSIAGPMQFELKRG